MRRIPSVDPERLSTVVVVGGTLFALGLAFLGGFVARPPGSLTGLLYLFALGFPVLGVLIVVVTLRWAVDTAVTAESEFGETSADDSLRRGKPVDHEMSEALRLATRARYRCRSIVPAGEIRDWLQAGAVRVVRTRAGLDHARAVAAVRTGRWTDDPVAAAFLADDPDYPLSERLYAALDPGRAYRRRVRRTIDAIETFDELAAAPPRDESGGPTGDGPREREDRPGLTAVERLDRQPDRPHRTEVER